MKYTAEKAFVGGKKKWRSLEYARRQFRRNINNVKIEVVTDKNEYPKEEKVNEATSTC